jgi:hypothetical protein
MIARERIRVLFLEAPGETKVKSIVRAVAASILLPALSACGHSPSNPSAAPATKGPATPLQPFTAQDGSASAQLPAGWKIAKQGETVIDATGPNGEDVSLGNTFIVRNAPYQAGKVAGADLDIPYQDNLEQKFTLIFQHSAGLAGAPLPQITFISAIPIQGPKIFGQCATFLGTMSASDATGPANFEGAFCSLPLDVGGTYKNIFKFGTVPAKVAAQERSTIEAVLASYSVPMPWLQKKLAPNFAAPPQPAGGASAIGSASTAKEAAAINAETLNMMRGANVSANCFDLNERDTPIWKLPPSCGGPGGH